MCFTCVPWCLQMELRSCWLRYEMLCELELCFNSRAAILQRTQSTQTIKEAVGLGRPQRPTCNETGLGRISVIGSFRWYGVAVWMPPVHCQLFGEVTSENSLSPKRNESWDMLGREGSALFSLRFMGMEGCIFLLHLKETVNRYGLVTPLWRNASSEGCSSWIKTLLGVQVIKLWEHCC